MSHQISFLLLLLSFLFSLNTAAQSVFHITQTDCFTNAGTDDIRYQYQTPDGGLIALVYVEKSDTYFQDNLDSSFWLLKFDSNLKLVKKVFLSKENELSMGFDFKINKTGNSILCSIDSTDHSYNYINRFIVFDFDLNILKIVPIEKKINFDIALKDNLDGGYTIKYNLWDLNYKPDSIGIVVLNKDGSLRLQKYIIRTQLDTLKYLAATPATTDIYADWLVDVTADAQYIYSVSTLNFFEPGMTQKIGVMGITLDTNMQVVSSRVLENRFSEGTYSNRCKLFQFSPQTILVAYNGNSYSLRLYFTDTNFDTIVSPNYFSGGNYYNEILQDELDYFNRPQFDIKISNNQVFIPYFHRKNTSISDTVFSTSTIMCFDLSGHLIQKIELDSIPTGLQQRVIYYKILSDASILVLTENVLLNGYNFIISKFNQEGRHLWSFTVPRDRIWENTYLSQDYFRIEPQIETIAGKERLVHVFMEYSHSYPAEYDTSQIWDYILEFNSGKQVDSSIVCNLTSPVFETMQHAWKKVKRISDKEYALVGFGNEICSSNDVDIYSCISSIDFNTIVPNVFIDRNSNSILDSTEQIVLNNHLSISKNNIPTVTYFHNSSSNPIYVDTGLYIVNLINDNNYYIANPDSIIKYYSSYQNTDTITFALQPVLQVNDLMIQFNNNRHGRPGFYGSYTINVINNGTTTEDAVVKVKMSDWIDSITTFPPVASIEDTLIWTIHNLDPFEEITANFFFHYKEPPVNNVGDTLISSAIVYLNGNDTTPQDNISVLKDIMSGSFDPNDKLADCYEYSQNDMNAGKYIKYTIRFENTGNDTAFRIQILDTLDNNLDLKTLRLLKAQFNYEAKVISPNILSFSFDPIWLPPNAYSSVSYLVKPNSILNNGTTIQNRAGIKFDYNEPVITNSTTTTISLVSGYSQNFSSPTSYTVFPNPATNAINVSFHNPLSVKNIKIIDVNGKIVYSYISHNQNFISFDVNGLTSGIYLLSISEDGKTADNVKIIISNR